MSHSGYEDRRGSRVERADLTGAVIRDTYLNDARIELCDCRGLVIRGSLLVDVTISGEIGNLVVNEVDVTAYVEEELDRRHPERAKLRPTDAAGFREAWDILERLWAETVAHARTLPAPMLHESVDGEWSFIQTLRHLVFATDSWVRRALLGEPSPYDPLDLPFDDMPPIPGVPWDRDARPTLEEVLALRADRQATVRGVLASLTDERLAGRTTPVSEPGYPPPDSYPVAEVLSTILNEEWWHRRYAERDLAILQAAT